MNGATHKCPNDPSRSRSRDCIAFDLGYFPWHTQLEVGAGDGWGPPEQDAGWLRGHKVVTLCHGMTVVLTLRSLGHN